MCDKSGYDDFMLKEIHEQPQTVIDTLKGRVLPDTGKLYISELTPLESSVSDIERILVLACGTSWHSGLLGKIFIEKYAQIPVEVQIASEYPNSDLTLNKDVLCMCVSQSGETTDTKNAMQTAKKLGGKIVAVCNVIGSSMAREADYAIYTYAGPEISIASTKAFMSQAVTFLLFALWLGEKRKTIDNNTVSAMLNELLNLPEKIRRVLKTEKTVKETADFYKNTGHFIYLGRHYNCPIAFEGALKLKETTYIHSEAYPSGELKHGPVAILDENFPVMIFVPAGKANDKIFSNLQEARARGSKVIAVMSEISRNDRPESDHQLYIPDCNEEVSPFLTVVVAQLFAYFTAKGLGKDVDKPRNLVKSVLAE
ncbi:MAG: glutamine--fructose-6-phosphate transaminase (isomerizing) [Deferribacteraceae bacterium]|jgi:glucosamine--fructose-6-phosphate aminotransferase (isomerizing)|nr:glutamine--fructose-6-phosphate transaminase (isomerizing) [Deferribacteraceae bacterium]